MVCLVNDSRYEWQGYKDPNTPVAGVKVQTISYVYDGLPDLLVFDIVYVSGLSQAAIADTYNMTLSTFPSFVLEETAVKRGYLTWAGNSEWTKLATGIVVLVNRW